MKVPLFSCKAPESLKTYVAFVLATSAVCYISQIKSKSHNYILPVDIYCIITFACIA